MRAKGQVLHLGEAVATGTREEARAAVRLIRVEYGELPAVLSPEEGLAEGAPIRHPGLRDDVKLFDAGSGGNLRSRTEPTEGDVDAAWDASAVIVEGGYATAPQAHVSPEPCGALAGTGAQGRVTLGSANRPVFRVQATMCESLALPLSRLRRLTPRVGAGFGNRMEPHVRPLTVALALKAGRMRRAGSPPAISRCCWTAAPVPATARACRAVRCRCRSAPAASATGGRGGNASAPTRCTSGPVAASATRR